MSNKVKTFEIKEGNKAEDLQSLKAEVFIVLGYFLIYCREKKLHAELTNILQKFSVSKSDTHPEGRAFDTSVKVNWSKKDIDDCIEYMDEKVGHFGAISASTGKRRVAYFHNAGLGDHFHFQVSR